MFHVQDDRLEAAFDVIDTALECDRLSFPSFALFALIYFICCDNDTGTKGGHDEA